MCLDDDSDDYDYDDDATELRGSHAIITEYRPQTREQRLDIPQGSDEREDDTKGKESFTLCAARHPFNIYIESKI